MTPIRALRVLIPCLLACTLAACQGPGTGDRAGPAGASRPTSTPPASRATGVGAAAISGRAPGEGSLHQIPERRSIPSLQDELRAREEREISAFRKRYPLQEHQGSGAPDWFGAQPVREGNDLLVPATATGASIAEAYRRAVDAGTRATVEIPRAAMPDAAPAKAAFARLPSDGFRVWVLMRTRAPGPEDGSVGPAPAIDLSGSTPHALLNAPAGVTPESKPAGEASPGAGAGVSPAAPPTPVSAKQEPDWWFEGIKEETGHRGACARADRAELRDAVREAVESARASLMDAGMPAATVATAEAERTSSTRLPDGTYRAFVLVRARK